ncbi:hypothetical protein BSKO_11730 [Bryopsis sp. KO-2023]|nr:hypothetical protein BSKO_11730 [Bryopsis sp. KO-2023]
MVFQTSSRTPNLLAPLLTPNFAQRSPPDQHRLPRAIHWPRFLRSTRISSSRPGGLEANFFGDSDAPDESVLVFTPDGVVRILGKPSKTALRLRVDEMLKEGMPISDADAICLGATFAVSATNGQDITRRMNFQGFCQSPDILGECIQEAVLGRGGEIVEAEKLCKNGAEQTLVMAVALPFLFGIPPEMDALTAAIEVGGGFLHKTYGEWFLY